MITKGRRELYREYLCADGPGLRGKADAEKDEVSSQAANADPTGN